MWLRLIGRGMQLLSRFDRGEGAADLDRVGEELVRLDRQAPAPPTTSR